MGIVGDGRALVRTATELKPDLIVLDVAMPVLDGLAAASEVKALLPAVKLIFVTMTVDETVAAEAVRRGASAYLPKTCVASELLAAVGRVWRGGSYLSPLLSEDRVKYLRGSRDKFVATAICH